MFVKLFVTENSDKILKPSLDGFGGDKRLEIKKGKVILVINPLQLPRRKFPLELPELFDIRLNKLSGSH
jgi:hypothetical protein